MKIPRSVVNSFFACILVVFLAIFMYLSITELPKLPKLLGSLQAMKFSKLEYSHSDSQSQTFVSPGYHFDFYTAEGTELSIARSFIADLKKDGYSAAGMSCSPTFASFSENNLSGDDHYSFEKPDKRFLNPHSISISMWMQGISQENSAYSVTEPILGCQRPKGKYLLQLSKDKASCKLPESTKELCVQ